MAKKAKEIKERFISPFFNTLRSCRICGTHLIATCDRSKKSELVQYAGSEATKTKPQFMWMYPTAKKQSDLCQHCQTMKAT
jgi:hypothetical protein